MAITAERTGASMSQSDAALTDFIARVRTMGATIQDAAARESRPLVEAEAKRTAAAGTDPYGAAWAPKKDGTRAMPDTADAIRVTTAGSSVVTKVLRGAAIQNRIASQGSGSRYGRTVIPSGDRPLSAGYVAALSEGAERAFRKAMAT